MFKVTSIIKAPSGRFVFVGRVHETLLNKSYDTVEDAKCAAVDCMMVIGETFPVAVSEQALGHQTSSGHSGPQS